jgi:hypothetical protein
VYSGSFGVENVLVNRPMQILNVLNPSNVPRSEPETHPNSYFNQFRPGCSKVLSH